MASDLLEYNRGRERWAAHLPLTHPVRVTERRAVMQPSNTPEEWRPVVGYEGRYEVSDHGKVRTVGRTIIRSNGHPDTYKTAVLSPADRNGYNAVQLKANGVGSTRYVHRLVLEAFVGPADGRVCCHGNGDRKDNRLPNLRWGTYRDNALDKAKHGRDDRRNRTRCPLGHRLALPNLERYGWERRGTRACLACSRARGYLTRHPEMRHRLHELADQYYRKITEPVDPAEGDGSADQ